jgi:hypothetical protein
MPLQTRNIGRIPVYFGDYVPGRAYQEKHRVTLYGSEFQAAKDNPSNAPLTYNPSTHKITAWNVVNGDHASPTGEWYIISNGTDAWIASHRMDDIEAHIDSSYNAMETYVKTADSSIETYVKTADSSLQGQINDIVASQTSISLSGSPSVIYAAKSGQTVSLSSKITTIGTISSHKILKGTTIISSGTGSNLSGSDPSTNTTNDITYTTESIINGVKVTKNSTVYVRYPIYFGAAATWDAINNDSHKAPARTSPVGTYSITVSQNGHSVFFNVPSEMSITKATVSGFDMPFKPYVSKTIDGKAYKSYESANTYIKGTLNVVIVS